MGNMCWFKILQVERVYKYVMKVRWEITGKHLSWEVAYLFLNDN